MAHNTKYGWFKFRPNWLQFMNKPWCFLIVLSLGTFFMGAIVNGFSNVALTSIETRFGISASALSIIPSSFDVAGLLCVIPVSYVGGRASQPRILGLGMLIMGIGSFIMFLPHVFTLNEPSPMDTLKLQGSQEVGFCNSTENPAQANLKGWVAMFALGMLIIGIGASPLWANTFDYFDKNLPDSSFALYAGIFTMSGVVGPGAGYIIGSWFLSYPFDDVLKQDDFYRNLTGDQYQDVQEDTNFIGAYWLGFILSSFWLLLVALPLGAFPYEFPESEKLRNEKTDETFGSKNGKMRGKLASELSWPDFKIGVTCVLRNPIFLSLAFAASMEMFFISVLSSFGPKYLESVYNVSSSDASLLMGMVLAPSAIFALVGGGIFVKVFKLGVQKSLIFCLICAAVTCCCLFGMFIPCKEANFIKPADQWELPGGSGQVCDVTSCDCSRQTYKPYCLDSTNVLFSPCYFGCESESFKNCSCFDPDLHSSFEKGTCEITEFCATSKRNWVLVLLAVAIFSTFFNIPAAESALDRSIHQDFRSLAFGMNVFAMRIIGAIPGPLIAGAIFDSNCEVWQETRDGERGSCIHYHGNFKLGLILLLIVPTAFMTMGFCLSVYFSFNRPKVNDSFSDTNTVQDSLSPSLSASVDNFPEKNDLETLANTLYFYKINKDAY